MNPLTINADLTGMYYSLFYFFAFLVGFVVLMMEGSKNRFPIIPWLMVIGTAFLFFIIGCRVINYTWQDWAYIIRLEPLPYATSLSILGGILFSIPGILLAKRCLSFRNEMMDVFAWVLPIGFMIQRVGCLLAGCCYGSTTHVPWSIQYRINSLAYLQQVHEGLLDPNAPYSLPVHPVQLYEMACCLAIIFLLKKIRNYIQTKGNLFLISITLYGAFRFFLEFLRSAASDARQLNFLQLNFVQRSILFFIVLMLIIILYLERKNIDKLSVSRSSNHPPIRILIYFLSLASLFILSTRFLSVVEILALCIVILAIILQVLRHWFIRFTVRRLGLVSLALPLVAMLLMSQTMPEKKGSDKLSYTTISAGIMAGSSNMYYGNFGSGGCTGGTPSTAAGWDNSYSAKALGISYTNQKALHQNFTLGLNYFSGQHSEDAFTPASSTNQRFSTFGINPYFLYNRKDVGFGIGMHFGDFTRIVPTEKGASSSVIQNSFYPSFNFRVGALDQVFLEYKLANQFPACFPALTHQIALGIGTKRRNRAWRGGAIRVGTASNAGFFIAPSTAIGNHVILDTYIGWGGGIGTPYEHVSNSTVSASLHYKIFKKEE